MFTLLHLLLLLIIYSIVMSIYRIFKFIVNLFCVYYKLIMNDKIIKCIENKNPNYNS